MSLLFFKLVLPSGGLADFGRPLSRAGEPQRSPLPHLFFRNGRHHQFFPSKIIMKFRFVAALFLTSAVCTHADQGQRPVKVFILAGDGNCLEQGVIAGRTEGRDAVFYPNEKPMKDEVGRHVNGAIYQGAYNPGTDYDKLTPVWAGLVGLGENQAARRKPRPYIWFVRKRGITTTFSAANRVVRS